MANINRWKKLIKRGLVNSWKPVRAYMIVNGRGVNYQNNSKACALKRIQNKKLPC